MAQLAGATVEGGTLGEFFANAGTVAASQLQAHNGTWSVRANPVAATGTVSLRPPGGDMGRTTTTIYEIWFRIVTFPGIASTIADVQSSAASSVASISVTTAGVVTGVGATTSATVATVTANTWWCAKLTVLSNGASSLAIDGLGAAQSFTANNVTQDRLVMGVISAAQTMDIYVDDPAIYDVGYRAGGVAPVAGQPLATVVPKQAAWRGAWIS